MKETLIQFNVPNKNGIRYLRSSIKNLPKELPIFLQYNGESSRSLLNVAGFAKLSLENDRVVADVKLVDTDVGNVAKCLIEHGGRNMCYRSGGTGIISKDGVVEEYIIDRVSLCPKDIDGEPWRLEIGNEKIENPNLLCGCRVYTVGHMQYANGESWRLKIATEFDKLGIIVFDPYKKPFVEKIEEGEDTKSKLQHLLDTEQYGEAQRIMRKIRSYDLNLVDRSDFIVSHIIPNVASWGSAEELVTAVRMKKPTFISIEGGKKKCPFWLLGMFPDKYIYNSVDEIIEMVKKIDNGQKEMDSDRWRLLDKKYR